MRVLLAAAALLLAGRLHAQSSAASLRYAAYCAVAADGTLTGYVTSQGPESIQVQGMVRFVLWSRGSMGQEELQAMGSGLIPSGATAQVAQARVPHPISEDTRCYLDLSSAARPGVQ